MCDECLDPERDFSMTPPSIAGIILAAGAGTPKGRLKPLLPFQGRPLLARVMDAAFAGRLDPVVVVLGHGEAEVRRQIVFGQALVCSNPDYALGQSSSLKAGLGEIPQACAAAMFLLGDQPLVNAVVIHALLQAYGAQRPWLVIPTFGGRRGNPVIVDRALFHRIQGLQGDTGARVLFTEFAHRSLEVPVDEEGILVDLDTPEDYENLLRQAEGKPTGHVSP
jgi:molybdenum cofactor cytidylyltransferase